MNRFLRALVFASGAFAFGLGLWQSIVPALDENLRKATGQAFAVGVWNALTTPGGIYRGLIPHGIRAPSFEATTHPDRLLVSTDDWKGRVVVLTFWATWCEPCREEAPMIRDLVQEYTSKNVVFWAANDDGLGDPNYFKSGIPDLTPQVSRFLSKNRLYDFPVVYPPPGTDREYRIRFLPSVYVIGRNGRIIFDWAGPLQKDKLKAAIDFALRAKA